MKVDALAVELRPRSMTEAADLGVRMVQANAQSVWRSFVPVYAVVVALALSTVDIAPWLPAMAIFWLKPWLDRSLLFVLSRAVFGQSTTFMDLWMARRAVWWPHLAATLSLRRLSPWRSFTQPIEQLEGQLGAARRARTRTILNGQHGSALAMQFAFGNLELAFIAGILAATAWFAPPGHPTDAIGWLSRDDSTLAASMMALSYAGVVLLVEPFFVAAGFAMYLNRRVQLEAWDVEQEFRRTFA
jgi:hypothetical protein